MPVDGGDDRGVRQRAVLYPHSRRVGGGGNGGAGASSLPVPNWFDLPVLLPESHVVAARMQRNMTAKSRDDKPEGPEQAGDASGTAGRGRFAVPSVSRLNAVAASPVVPLKGAISAMRARSNVFSPIPTVADAAGRSHLKRRNSARRLDGLPFDRRSRLRAKLWRDLDRFGLWHMMDDDGSVSVDQTIDSIMAQWQRNDARVADSTAEHQQEELRGESTDFGWSRESTPAENAFLIALPSSMPPDTASTHFIQPAREDVKFPELRSLPSTGSITSDSPELDKDARTSDDERDEGPTSDDHHDYISDPKLTRGAPLPGMKRRQRLKDLHQFVETQLQKRLLKSWDTIEVAFTGSGEMTISQIVKFLQHSDVHLGDADAAKVKAILEQHTALQEEGEEQQHGSSSPLISVLEANEEQQEGIVAPTQGSNNAPVRAPPGRLDKKKTLFSYDGFRQIFRSRNAQEESRWKREFDRERMRKRQEKEIYDRELAALEERVKLRLAESAKNMIEILDHFRCDPLNIPWETEQQRLQLRSQFLEIIFRKRQQQMSLTTPATETVRQDAQSAGKAFATSCIPEKLSIKLVHSAMLQKYSRNGHFESIEVSTAAYLFHDYVIDSIKRGVQTYWKRLETDLWPERQMIFRFRLKKQAFLEWKRFTKHAETLRRYVMRRFTAWKYFTRKRYEYYVFYRACFWPFYTWKRHLQQMIIARGKSTFLKNLVHTYILLRHFRALKKLYRREQWFRTQLGRVRVRKARAMRQVCWNEWKSRYQSAVAVRRIWCNRGHAMQHLHKLYMVRVTFYILRYYVMLKRDMEQRKHKALLTLYSPNLRVNAKSPTRGTQSGKSNASLVASSNNSNSRSPYSMGAPWEANGASDLSRLRGFASTSQMVHRDGVGENYGIHSKANAGRHLDARDTDHSGDLFYGDATRVADNNLSNVHPLTRIMETEMGQRMKRKSRLYDLCLALYLHYRERDQVEMIGNVITFRRVGRIFIKMLRAAVARGKKSRFASDLGAFRVLHARFHQWRVGTICSVVRPSEDADEETEFEEGSQVGAASESSRVELHWANDREWRREGIENNPLLARQLREDLLGVLANDSIRRETIRDRELLLMKKQQQEESFLRKEAGVTHRIKMTEMQQAQQLLRTRAQRMHDALDHVYDDLQQQQMRWLLRSSFRSLRAVVMLKYTEVLCHRSQLRNWIRICRRFIYWQQHVDAFYRLKIKHHAFQTLLRHAVWKWKFQSPQLTARLQQRRGRMLQYEAYLERTKLVDGSLASFHLSMTRHSPANTFHGVFLRWVQFTQVSKVLKLMVELSRQKRDVWYKFRVFHALKSGVKAKYSLEYRREHAPFLLRHYEADLDACHCKIVALRALLPSTILRAKILRNARLTQLRATGSPTLKQLFAAHAKEIDERLALERRLMFTAYSERKAHHYEERSSPLYGSNVGRVFVYEKAPPYGSVSEVVVIYSPKKVDGLSFVVKTNAAVSYQGALHGNPFGNREVFALIRGEVLTSIEGFASQQVYALRFGTSSGRLSKWYGLCEKGTKFEIRSDYANKREEIVGIFGHADGTSINALGAVMRHTTAKNLFEGLWLQSEAHRESSTSSIGSNSSTSGGDGEQRSTSDNIALTDRQFAYFLQVRACEVKLAVQRAHQFALRAYRSEQTPTAFRRVSVLMMLARWLVNALAHGLVRGADNEHEGQRILAEGMEKKSAGDRAIEEATRALQVVDSYRGADGQLDAAILGIKKINELRDMMDQAHATMSQASRWIAEGKSAIQQGQCILPHLPITRRMLAAVREMYRVVQTKDYIDQMDPELRAILMLKDGGNGRDSDNESSDIAPRPTRMNTGADHDVAVMATAGDASLCKLSASALGYFHDPFVRFFVKAPSRRMPIINRGYYARVAAVETLVTRFLASDDSGSSKKQVVILGAGLDTMFFRLKEADKLQGCEYFELDFADVTMQKVMAVRRRKQLSTLLGLSSPADFQAAVSSGATELNAIGYHLLPVDLRDLDAMSAKLEASGFDYSVPTLFVSECVLIYMEAQFSTRLVDWAGSRITNVSFVLYEQILPDDAFGRVMMSNIKARGCDLLSIHDFPSVDAQIKRFTDHQFEMAQCWDMNDVYYKFLDPTERAKREKLEIFDELEEFHMLQAHYCVVVASRRADSPAARALALVH